MEIRFDTSTASTDELNALMAFILSLGASVPQTNAKGTALDVVAPTPAPFSTPSDEAEPPISTEAELDADGLPWDDRIHASSRVRNADGTWRKKRGVDEVLFGQIAAELQEAHSGDQAQAAPPPPVSVASPAPPPPADTGNAVESAPPAGRFADFPAFVQGVNAIKSPAIPYLELNTFAQNLGVAGGFKDMKDHPEIWEMFYNMAASQ